MQRKILTIFSFFLFIFLSPIFVALAQESEIVSDSHTLEKAVVVDILSVKEKFLAISDTPVVVQTLEVKIFSGENKGRVVIFDNDYSVLDIGDKFILSHTTTSDGRELFAVSDHYRLPILLVLIGLFILITVIFGGIQGGRGILSLAGSLVIIFFVLLPLLIKGYNPVVVSILVSSAIIVTGSYVTHGFNRTTSTAVIGMIGTIIVTGILAIIAVKTTALTGFSEDESVYLAINTKGALDATGLLLGGILIGLLGTLYDASISQAIAVEEIHLANPDLTKKEVYKRVIRMGREHIGALVDTLAIAYVGAALPLLLLIYSSTDLPLGALLNQEIFATEIVRIVIGSIGVILAVPATTYISTMMLVGKIKKRDGHTHSHSHSHSHSH